MPRVSSQAEQETEIKFIRAVEGWPLWPYLPVKQYQPDGSFPKCGTIVDRGAPGIGGPKLEPVVIYDWCVGIGQFDQNKVIARYDTIEAMVADNWVGD